MINVKVRDIISIIDYEEWIKVVDRDGIELFSGTKDEIEVSNCLNEVIESIWSEFDEWSSCITILIK